MRGNLVACLKVRNIWIILSVFFAFVLLFPSITHAEQVSNFSSDISVQKDSDIDVIETIQYDFQGDSRHGIFRTIPLGNSDGSQISVTDITVADGSGNAIPETTSESGNDLTIKIGDPNILVTGTKTYVISYVVHNAMVSFSAYDELYWNVTGNEWEVPISHVSATVSLPTNDPAVQASCYRGPAGSSTTCVTPFTPEQLTVSESGLSQGDGVTIAVALKKGIIMGIGRIGGQTDTVPAPAPLSTTERAINFGIIALCLLSFVGSFALLYGARDPKSKKPLVAWYEAPNGLPPVIIGTLVDKTTDMRDVTAQILSLAVRGYLSIARSDHTFLIFDRPDYEFTVVKDTKDLTSDLDRHVLQLLFMTDQPAVGTSAMMSDLKTRPSEVRLIINTFSESTKSFLVTNGYFEVQKRSALVKGLHVFFIIMIYVGFRMGGLFDGFGLLFVPTGIACTFILVGIKNRYTVLGADTKQQALGFKEFLSVTEKSRIDFANAPEKNPTMFMECLPYAIAFGVEEKWAQQFEGFLIPQPTWYQGSAVGTFMAIDFVREMGSFTTSFSSMATPARSGSGGGGFSGGGSGGGGGGSW